MGSTDATARPELTVALLPWGNVLEDFLDTIGVSLESFCDDFTGSWMFGYVSALKLAGVRTALVVVSGRATAPRYAVHAPTGATICILPAPRLYRLLRRWVRNPYGRTVERVFGELRGPRRLLFPLLAVLRELLPYLATPVGPLARALRRLGCDALLCQEYEYARFDVCVLLGRLMRLPVFASFQGGDEQWSRIERFVRPLTIRTSAGLIVASSDERLRVRRRYRLRPAGMASVFNPLDLALWRAADRDAARDALGIPPEARVVAWHGRVAIEHKGLDILAGAWQRVCRERAGRDLRLLLVGTGHDAERLRRLIETLQLRGVTWLDEFVHDRDTLRGYLSAADVYAFASRHEGFPVAPLEAMACGLPVVAADAQGLPDILAGGEADGGILVPRGDAAALAVALGRLLDDEPLARELGRRARRRAEACFSYEAVGPQLRAFLSRGGG